MRQVFLKSGRIRIEEIPSPSVAANRVLVANAYSLLSTGTESVAVKQAEKNMVIGALRRPQQVRKAIVHARRNGLRETASAVSQKFAESKSLGYSCSGWVLAVGDEIMDVNVGDLVACGGAGYANHAEVVSVPRNLLAKVPEGVGPDESAFTTLGAIAMHGVRRAGCTFGETVVVLGLGLVGLLAAQIAKAGGYRVVGLDIVPDRVEKAIELGVDRAWLIDDAVRKRVLSYTGGLGADAVVVCAATESSEPSNLALELCRQKARVVCVGAFGLNLDRERMYAKELDVVMSTSYGPGRYDPAYEEDGLEYPIGYVRWTENRNMNEFLRLLCEGRIKVKPMIDRVFGIEQAPEAYESANCPDRPLATLIRYEPRERVPIEHSIAVRPRTTTQGSGKKINVAVVGAGSFARQVHLPLLKNLNAQFHVKWVVARDGKNAKTVAERFRIERASTSYDEVLRDPETDLVLIATRHDQHYPMVVEALRRGKAVFVEKPLCLRREELAAIEEEVDKAGRPLFVGFNRRYSPMSTMLRRILEKSSGPKFILYRVNAGFIDADHWTQDPKEGGGRIIGEACHFFDLFNYLIGEDKKVIDVSAKSVPINGGSVVARDNLSAAIRYSDGSLATLCYTALGHPGMGKEHMEIFAANKSFILVDYQLLRAYGHTLENIGTGKVRDNTWTLKEKNKGHKEQLIEIAKSLQGEPNRAISLGEIWNAMHLTFAVDEMLIQPERPPAPVYFEGVGGTSRTT